MITREDFYDRVRRQDNWSLDYLDRHQLVLVGNGRGMARTLSLAAASCGMKNLVLSGAPESGGFLRGIAGEVMGHLGREATSFVPVYAGFFLASSPAGRRVWLIDAGDVRNDGMSPRDEPAFYYAECHEDGQEFISVGTDRNAVAAGRKGEAASDRAEIPMVCSQLLIGALAEMHVCDELEPLPGWCCIPLAPIPAEIASLPKEPAGVLCAGGGGAISHQELWAESLDPVLRRANSSTGRHFVIVDPGNVHESCRSRQWGYTPETCGSPKAVATARWLHVSLFPGVRVSHIIGRLDEEHFRHRRLDEAISSIDNWTGRKVLSRFAGEYGIPWWSAGSSFFGGFARRISHDNPWCASADEGVERLSDRPDDAASAGTSCSGAEVPMPSSVLPQMILAGFIAAQRRQIVLNAADPRVLARGIEVHLTHGSSAAGYEGLRWGPGRALNLRNPG